MQKGLIHIYTGNGKGKTTTAVGLSVRAWGRGFKILFVQFLKGSPTGELVSFEKFGERFEVRRGKEIKKFVWNMTEEEKLKTAVETTELFKRSIKEAVEGDFDMLVMDEILGSITNKFIQQESIIDFINSKPEKLELILTGRSAPSALIELADYVSEINPIKHPMENGIAARAGIEN